MSNLTVDERADLQAEIHRLEGEVAAAKVKLYSKRDSTPSALKTWAWLLWVYLLGFVVGSASRTGWVLRTSSADETSTELSLVIAAGVLGAALSGLISLNERVANGWEYDDGTREPDPAEKKERFNRRLTWGFLARPFLGIVAGLLVWTGGRFGGSCTRQASLGLPFFVYLEAYSRKHCLIGSAMGSRKSSGNEAG